jgi:topoisomerase IV subunit A
VIYLEVSPTEKAMPKTLHVSLDGRGGARMRELDFDLTPLPVSSRSAKGLTITKWNVKGVKRIG